MWSSGRTCVSMDPEPNLTLILGPSVAKTEMPWERQKLLLPTDRWRPMIPTSVETLLFCDRSGRSSHLNASFLFNSEIKSGSYRKGNLCSSEFTLSTWGDADAQESSVGPDWWKAKQPGGVPVSALHFTRWACACRRGTLLPDSFSWCGCHLHAVVDFQPLQEDHWFLTLPACPSVCHYDVPCPQLVWLSSVGTFQFSEMRGAVPCAPTGWIHRS